MAGDALGEAFVRIVAKTDELDRQLSALKKQVESEGESAANAFTGAFAKVGPMLAAAFSVTAIISFGKHAVAAFADAEAQAAKFEAVLKATNSASGMTSNSMNTLATSMSRLTGIEDDSIVASGAVLATFKSISGVTFERTMKSAADLAVLMGSDLQSAVLQLGKALEEPEIGLTALRRSGVSFTESEKELIKSLVESGNQLEAQNIILTAVEKQLGGVAEAVGNTAAGAFKKLANEAGNLMEILGGELFGMTMSQRIGVYTAALIGLQETIIEMKGGADGTAKSYTELIAKIKETKDIIATSWYIGQVEDAKKALPLLLAEQKSFSEKSKSAAIESAKLTAEDKAKVDEDAADKRKKKDEVDRKEGATQALAVETALTGFMEDEYKKRLKMADLAFKQRKLSGVDIFDNIKIRETEITAIHRDEIKRRKELDKTNTEWTIANSKKNLKEGLADAEKESKQEIDLIKATSKATENEFDHRRTVAALDMRTRIEDKVAWVDANKVYEAEITKIEEDEAGKRLAYSLKTADEIGKANRDLADANRASITEFTKFFSSSMSELTGVSANVWEGVSLGLQGAFSSDTLGAAFKSAFGSPQEMNATLAAAGAGATIGKALTKAVEGNRELQNLGGVVGGAIAGGLQSGSWWGAAAGAVAGAAGGQYGAGKPSGAWGEFGAGQGGDIRANPQEAMGKGIDVLAQSIARLDPSMLKYVAVQIKEIGNNYLPDLSKMSDTTRASWSSLLDMLAGDMTNPQDNVLGFTGALSSLGGTVTNVVSGMSGLQLAGQAVTEGTLNTSAAVTSANGAIEQLGISSEDTAQALGNADTAIVSTGVHTLSVAEAVSQYGINSEQAAVAMNNTAGAAANFSLSSAGAGQASSSWAQASAALAVTLNIEGNALKDNIASYNKIILSIAAVDERTRGLANANAALTLADNILANATLFTAAEVDKASEAHTRLTEIEKRRKEVIDMLSGATDRGGKSTVDLQAELAGLNTEAKNVETGLVGMTDKNEEWKKSADKKPDNTGLTSTADLMDKLISKMDKFIERLGTMSGRRWKADIEVATTEVNAAPNAKGNVFDNGVKRYANGGVFSKTTLFGFGDGRLGMLGEAGAEAVMPLERTPDGRLGVLSQGGGGGVIVNVAGSLVTQEELLDAIEYGLNKRGRLTF